MTSKNNNDIVVYLLHPSGMEPIRFALFEFRPNLALHLKRSSFNHSIGYASADDSPTCLASFALILEPFMKYAS